MRSTNDIRTLCEQHGLQVGDVIVEGDMVQLVPASLDGLPPADHLQRLAVAIRSDDIRYVTLVVGHE